MLLNRLDRLVDVLLFAAGEKQRNISESIIGADCSQRFQKRFSRTAFVHGIYDDVCAMECGRQLLQALKKVLN